MSDRVAVARAFVAKNLFKIFLEEEKEKQELPFEENYQASVHNFSLRLRHFSNQAKERSTTHLFGITLKV